jgi:uncharacterized protein (DUF58 family)
MLARLLFGQFGRTFRIDRALRRRLTPAGLVLFGTVMTAAVFGIDTRQTLAFQVFSLASGLLLVAMLANLRFRCPLVVERQLPETATAGRPTEYRVRISNPTPVPQAGLTLSDELYTPLPDLQELRDEIEANPRRGNWIDRAMGYRHWTALLAKRRGGRIEGRSIPEVPPHGSRELVMCLQPLRRGTLQFQQVIIQRPDPLGLINALHIVPLADQLVVLPPPTVVPAIPAAGNRRFQPGGLSMAQRVGDSQEFISLREYRPGDPVRHVHWRSSARIGKLLVKEFQDQFFVRQALLLDCCTVPGDVFEYAVSVCASLARRPWHQDGVLDVLCIAPERVDISCGRGIADRRLVQLMLAAIQASPRADFEILSSEVRQAAASLSAIVAVLAAWDEPRRDLIRFFQQHGLPVFALIIAQDEAVIQPDETAARCAQFQVLVPPRLPLDAGALPARAPS